MLKIKTFFALILGSLVFVSPVLAGGSRISLFADNDSWSNDSGYGRIIRAYLNHDFYPCKGTQITFRFADPKDGDYISTGSNSSTYVMQEDRDSNGCSTYAKMASKDKGKRSVEVEVKHEIKNGDTLERIIGDTGSIKVDFDGEYHADNYYNGFSYRGSVNDPYGVSSNVSTSVPNEYPFTIIFPSAGATLKHESTYKILWSGWDKNDGNNVTSYSVYLVGGSLGSTGSRYLGSVDLNSQDWLSWTVPSDITPGYGYQIQFSGKGANGDNSESFSIVKKESEPILSRKIMLNVGNQVYNGGPKRTVYLSWNQVSQAKNYNVYVRLSDQKEFGEGLFGKPGTEYLYGYIGINAFLDYYIKVEACSNEGKCTYSPEVFLPAMKQENQEKNQNSVSVDTQITPTVNTNSEEIEQLNKKVQTLQNQLDDSKKSQSLLEQRLNSLISWLKSLFPFFK